MNSSVQIVSIGSRTPLGLKVDDSAIALRAGIASIADHPFMIDQVGEPMPGSLDAELPIELFGTDRMIALAESALRETCTSLSGIKLDSLPLFLGLPEIRPGFGNADVERIRLSLEKMDGLPLRLGKIVTESVGHAAGLSMLGRAVEEMSRGEFEACLVGGAESYFNPDTMEWIDRNRQLVGSISRSGFVPGEGAGFCLLMSDAELRRHGLAPLAKIIATSTTNEAKPIGSSEPCFGEGLADAVENAIGVLENGQLINQVFCDINSERYRGEEWGFVCLKLAQYFDDPSAYASPAEFWGDLGAASGPAFLMLVCHAATNGYSKGPLSMIWASSENGLRCVAILETEKLAES